MDGDSLDALTGGDDHLDVIKVHGHDDNLSIELGSIFVFLLASNQEKSLKLQSLCLSW